MYVDTYTYNYDGDSLYAYHYANVGDDTLSVTTTEYGNIGPVSVYVAK